MMVYRVPGARFKSNPRSLRNELYEAVYKKNHLKLKQLVHRSNIKDVVKAWDSDETALDLAIKRGDVVSIKTLLTTTSLHNWPKTTIFKAIKCRNLDIIQMMLDFSFPNDIALSEEWRSIWKYIIESDNVTILKLLIDYTDRINDKIIEHKKWKESLLLDAFKAKSSAIFECLLDRGVSIDSTDKFGWTILFHAVLDSRLSDVEMLIARGANLHHKNADNRNILHIAATHHAKNIPRALKMIQLFIDYGVDINAIDKYKSAPIHSTFSFPSFESDDVICLFLRQPEIDLTIPDSDGTTILQLVVGFSSIKVLKELLYKPNFDIKVLDKIGKSPFKYAISRNHYFPSMYHFKLVLEFGPDTNILRHLYESYLHFNKKSIAIKCFRHYQLKRRIAKLREDKSVRFLLAENVESLIYNHVFAEEISMFSSEIERMKKTKLYGKLTFYDFLHARNLTWIRIVNQPGMREMFTEPKHHFQHYEIMLAKNYLNFMRISQIESKAINSVDHNLNVLFNDKLPSLVVHKIKYLIDIQDILTLGDMKL